MGGRRFGRAAWPRSGCFVCTCGRLRLCRRHPQWQQLGPKQNATQAGILAFSGFIPTVDGWEPQIPRSTAAFIAHGRTDPIMDVEFARAARRLLENAGTDVEYHESDVGHTIDSAAIQPAVDWLKRVIA